MRYPSYGRLLALPEILDLGESENALVYYASAKATITAVKCFIVQAPGKRKQTKKFQSIGTGVTRLGEISTFGLLQATLGYFLPHKFQNTQAVWFVADILRFQKWFDVDVLGFQIKLWCNCFGYFVHFF